MNEEEISQVRNLLLLERGRSEVYLSVLKAFLPIIEESLKSGDDIEGWKIFAAWELCEQQYDIARKECIF